MMKQTYRSYCLICRTVIPMAASSNFSQSFSCLVNSCVGYEISSFRGAVDPA